MFVPRAASCSKFPKIQKIQISLIYDIYDPLIYTGTCHTQLQREMTLMQILKVPWLRTKKRVQTNGEVTIILCRAETRILRLNQKASSRVPRGTWNLSFRRSKMRLCSVFAFRLRRLCVRARSHRFMCSALFPSPNTSCRHTQGFCKPPNISSRFQKQVKGLLFHVITNLLANNRVCRCFIVASGHVGSGLGA